MQLTAELSLYPLRDDYIEAIKAFIKSAKGHTGLTIVTNAMSTQVSGDYDLVINLISQQLRSSYDTFGRQVLVCKLIPGGLEIQ